MNTEPAQWHRTALALLGLLLAGPLSGAETYRLNHANSPASYFLVATDTAGLLGFVGHRHAILAGEWSAELTLDRDNLAASSILFSAPTAALILDSEQAYRLAGFTRPLPPEPDRLATMARIRGTEVLNVAQNPAISFRSTVLRPSPDQSANLVLEGLLQLRADTQTPAPVTVKVAMQDQPGRLVFTGTTVIRQSDFGLKPFSLAGVVRVRDEIRLVWHLEVESDLP